VAHPDHRIADLILIHPGANSVDHACQIPADPDLAVGDHQPLLCQQAGAGGDVDRIHGGGSDPNAYLAVAGLGQGDLGHLEDIGAAEAANDNSSHALPPFCL
jgi:hypothetical protein